MGNNKKTIRTHFIFTMKTLTVFVLCIMAAYSATDLFAEIKTTDFGKTLTNTIELQLKSKDNIAQVISMVKEVRKGLRNEAEQVAADYKVVADACRAEFDTMDRKTDSLEAVVVKNQRLEMIDAPVLADRSSEKENRVAELAAVRTMMHQARSIITEAFGRDAEFLQT